MVHKKRINVYLYQKTINRADALARKLSYELGTEISRSNVLELAFELLRKQPNVKELITEAMVSLEQE